MDTVLSAEKSVQVYEAVWDKDAEYILLCLFLCRSFLAGYRLLPDMASPTKSTA